MPASHQGTHSVAVARGRKAFTQYVNGGGDAVLIAPVNARRISFFMQNQSVAAVYLGPAGVTAATGIEIAAGADFTDDESYDAWYYNPNGVVTDVRVIITVTDT